MDYYFIYGPKFSEILNTYTDIVGKPMLPEKFVFGHIQSKCCDWFQKETLEMGTMLKKIEKHRRFWEGKGPCLILIPPSRDMNEMWQVQIYNTENYKERFYNPEKMWENEMARAGVVQDWPTDGIPTIRPNLGVIFVPAIAGQGYELREGLMPWCKELMDVESIRAARDIDVTKTELMRLAERFYEIHRQRGDGETAAYHPDNQGIFDIAHLMYGENLFYDIMDTGRHAWVDEMLDISMELMVKTVEHIKKMMGEPADSMFHGHGTEQGVFFPRVGIRISEDAPTMISPEMIDRFVIGRIEKCGERFGGVFMHYCGRHEYFFERLCRCECVKAIDIGNPEAYDTRWLFETCEKTDTVLYSRVNAHDGEDWEAYTRRLAELVKQTGARCILRPLSFPKDRNSCEAMQSLWHELTE